MASYLAQWTSAKTRFETDAGKVVGRTKLAKPGKTGIFWIRKSSGMEKVCKLLDENAKATPEKAKVAMKKFEAQSNEYKNLLKDSATDDADYKRVKKQLNELSQAIDDIHSDFKDEWIRSAQEEQGKTAVAEITKNCEQFLAARTKMRTIRKSFETLRDETRKTTDNLEQALTDVRALAHGAGSSSVQWKRYLSEIQTILAGLEKSEALIGQMNECHDTVTTTYRNARATTLFQSTKPHKQKSANAQKKCEKILESMTNLLKQADDDHFFAFEFGQDGEHFREMAKEATARIADLEKEQERLASRKQNRGKTRL